MILYGYNTKHLPEKASKKQLEHFVKVHKHLPGITGKSAPVDRRSYLPKRMMDWKGILVRVKRKLKNGLGEMPAGTILLVEGHSRGLSLSTIPCSCCGVKLFVTKVPVQDVEVIKCPANMYRLELNKLRYYKFDPYPKGRHLVDPVEEFPPPDCPLGLPPYGANLDLYMKETERPGKPVLKGSYNAQMGTWWEIVSKQKEK